MRRVLALLVLVSMIVGVFTVPASAKTKSTSKTKTLELHFEDDYGDEEVFVSVPYYSKWKDIGDSLYGYEHEFETSKGTEVNISIIPASDNEEAASLCKWLQDKKYKKQIKEYLYDNTSMNELSGTSLKLKKDGSGHYLLIVKYANEFGVLRVLDGQYLVMYFAKTNAKSVAKSIQNKLISYTKQIKYEKKNIGTVELDPDIEILDTKLDADKVIFAQVYTNAAWGYQKEAIYIMGDGRVYSYDFAKNPGHVENIQSDESPIEYLLGTEPSCIVDKDYLMLMYSYAVHVNPDAKYTIKQEMYDYGQKNLYFYAADGTKIKAASYGDVRYIYDDKYATKLEELWNKCYKHCK